MKKLIALCIALCFATGSAFAKQHDTSTSTHKTHSAKSHHAKHAKAHKKAEKKSHHKKASKKHRQA